MLSTARNISQIVTLISLASIKPSHFSDKYLDDITKKYFLKESLLYVYWTNVSFNLTQNFIKYWATSESVKLETCAIDFESPKVNILTETIKNTVVMFGDMIINKSHISSLLKCQLWNTRSRILAVIEGENKNVASAVLELFWTTIKAIDVTVMLINPTTSTVQYFTMYPYHRPGVEKVTSNLFPNKIRNDFHGNTIKVATTYSEPYVLTPEVENEFTEGLEIRMFNMIAKRLNFRVEYKPAPEGENPWVSKTVNGRVTGLFGVVHRQEADVLFHGIRIRPDRCALADLILIHSFDTLNWVVPRNSFMFDWKSLFMIFRIEIWIAMFAFLFLITLAIYLISKPYIKIRLSDVFFQVLAQTLLSTVRYYHENHSYRIFMFAFSYYALILATLYQASLTTFLTNPAEGKQYKTIREAVDDGLTAYLYPGGKVYNLSDHDTWEIIFRPGRHIFSEDYQLALRLAAFNKTHFILDRRHVMEFEVHKNLLDHDNEPMVHIIEERVVDYWVAMFTSKGHPLNELFRVMSMNIFDSGLLDFWIKDIQRKNQKARHAGYGDSDDPVSLSMVHLKGAFQVYLVLLFVSAVTLVCEILYVNCKKKLVKARVKHGYNNFLRRWS